MTELEKISRNESILGLERITELLSLMGGPQDKLRVIHVAGTNGKGSFTAMLTSVLRAAGYKVGSFTSPALEGLCDSYRINCTRITDDELDKAVSAVAPFAQKMKDKPTEFEVMTAAAYSLFERESCDIAVIECGLGGDTDATNVIKKPLLSVITNVALDHTDRLGKTTGEIAAHKAGIIKIGRPVLFGGTDEAALEVISGRAEEMGSRLYLADGNRLRTLSSTLNGTEIEDGVFGRLRLGLLGEYQTENAATVLTAVEILRGEGLDIPDGAVKKGLAGAKWPARFEILHRRPYVIFDGSHNPDGVALAASTIGKLFGKKAVLLMGVMADKDYNKYPGLLSDCAGKIFTVKPKNPRSLEASALAKVFNDKGFRTHACSSVRSAVRLAYSYAERHGLPLVAMGTLYMYGEVKEELNKIEK